MAELLRAAKQKKEREEGERNAAQETAAAPISQTPPTSQPVPILQEAPIQNTRLPLSETAPVREIAPSKQAPAGHTRITHEVSDEIIPTLDVYSQAILQRLLRLSWGWQADTCKVGLPTLSNACNISESQARRAVRTLVARKLIEVTGHDFSNLDQTKRGTNYRILIAAAPSRRIGGIREVAPTYGAAPFQQTPNKDNYTNKENTQTQDDVSVSSKFSLEECQRYAAHLKTTGQGITNPGGYATKIHRNGEADALIEKFINPTPTLDISKCPDCEGKGYYFPDPSKPETKRCTHERLSV